MPVRKRSVTKIAFKDEMDVMAYWENWYCFILAQGEIMSSSRHLWYGTAGSRTVFLQVQGCKKVAREQSCEILTWPESVERHEINCHSMNEKACHVSELLGLKFKWYRYRTVFLQLYICKKHELFRYQFLTQHIYIYIYIYLYIYI